MNKNKPLFAKKLGHNIAKYRQKMGLTQEQLAEKLDLGNEAVSRIERGVAMPSLMRLFDFATVFHCQIHELLVDTQSTRKDDIEDIALLLNQLDEKDRCFVIKQLELLIDHLKDKT